MAEPLISIIVPTLNEADAIENTLASLQAGRGHELEIILADGGSSDNTISRANPLVDVVVKSVVGRAQQMNTGATSANGEFLLFLHADTQIPEHAKDELIRACSDGELIWGFFAIRLDNNRSAFRVIEKCMNLRSRFTRVATGDQCVFIRRSTYREIDGFKAIPLMEDVEISKRLRKIAEPQIVEYPVITSARRWEKHGLISSVLLMWWLRFAFFVGVSPRYLHAQYYTSSDKSGA